MTKKLLNAYGAPCSKDEAVARIRAYAVEHGVRATAREFGVSAGSVSGIINGTAKITGKRIVSWFAGQPTMIACPVLGVVSPQACREHAAFAKTRASRMLSNPEKMRLYITCRNCPKANGGQHVN
jgi:hypothetical protein